MTDHKILVVSFTEDDKIAFGNFDVSEVAEESKWKYTTEEEFQNNKRYDKFDYVLFYIPESMQYQMESTDF